MSRRRCSSSAPTSRSVSACVIASSSSIGAVLAQADVAVRVDQAGHDPATGPLEHRLGAVDQFGAQHAADDPPLDRLAIGQPRAAADVPTSSALRASAHLCPLLFAQALIVPSALRASAHRRTMVVSGELQL